MSKFKKADRVIHVLSEDAGSVRDIIDFYGPTLIVQWDKPECEYDNDGLYCAKFFELEALYHSPLAKALR